MASEQDDSIITVVTCEGNISDPDFPYKLSSLVARLRRLLLSADKPFQITNVEPWNSVRVTFNIPREAAQRLRQLAHAGDRVLRDLGILSVQIEGDQVISLTIAGRFNEPQEILLQTTDDDRTRLPSSSSLDVAALEASPAANSMDSSRKTISQFLSQQASTGSVALESPTSAASEIHFSGPQASPADFKSPNVVAPGSEPIPFPPKSTPTPPTRTPGYGPFPFASMTHAMNTMHSSHHTATTPPQGSSPSRFPFSPPPPYPGGGSVGGSGAFQPVRPSSYASSTSVTASATITTASSVATAATSPTVINNLPRVAVDRANAALTSPLLVNLLQSDLSQHPGGKVFPPPPSEPVAAPKRKRKPRKSKEKPAAQGAPGSPVASPTTSSSSCLSSSSLGTPASDSNPHSLFTQPFSITLPTVPGVPLSPSLTPPSVSPPALIGQPLNPKPLPAQIFSTHHPHPRVPPLPSPPPTAPPSSTSTSTNSGQSSQGTEHELSPWPSPSKRTQHLINPFTGQLEPMSSEEDEGEDSTDNGGTTRSLERVSESTGSSLQSNPFSDVGRRASTETTAPSPPASESKIREMLPSGAGETPPPMASPSSPSPTAPNSSPSEKIKLRLKLEPKSRVEKDRDSSKLGEKLKVDGIQPMLQYKVDVSFVNIPSRRVGPEATTSMATTAPGTAVVPSNPAAFASGGNILGSMANVAGANNSALPLEPRVPPLHISLRGRNAAVVTNPRRGREIGENTSSGDLTAAGKSPRSRSPRGFLMDRATAGGPVGATRTQNPACRKVGASRGGGNSRRGRGAANHTPPPTSTAAAVSGCSASAAAIISAVARNVLTVVTNQNHAAEGRAMAASPPCVAREKTLLSGGSFVLEPGRPSSSPSPPKQTAQVPSAQPANSPSNISSLASQISKTEVESGSEEGLDRKFPPMVVPSHHPEQLQSGVTTLERDSARGRANSGEKVEAADGGSADPINVVRENNHGQLSMQRAFVEDRLKPSNLSAGKVSLASSELNALLDRPVSPYNPNMARRNSAEGVKSENLVRPVIAKGMHEALATHSMRSKFQNALSTHQRNVLDERLQHNLEIAFPSESMPRERLKDSLRPELSKMVTGRRPSKEQRSVPSSGADSGHASALDIQPSRTSPSSQGVKQLISEEILSGAVLPTCGAVKEAELSRLRAEPVLQPPLVCHSISTEMPEAKYRTETLARQSAQERDVLRTSDNSKVCNTVPQPFVQSTTLVTVSHVRDRPASEVLASESQRESLIESLDTNANALPVILECAPTSAEEVPERQNPATVSSEPESESVSCGMTIAPLSDKTHAEIHANNLLAVVANDHALGENQILENCHISGKEEVAVSSPDETEVPLVDVDLPPQIPGIMRSSKMPALGPPEKLRLAATIGASSISQLMPAHGGSMVMEGIMPVGQLDGLPEEEGEGDTEFGPVESLPHHHLLSSVARSTSVAIVTITASPSSASPSGSSPDSLNIGGTSSEENGDHISGRSQGDHRGRHHPFPRNQCGSSGSPYEDSGIDSMDATMEKLPEDSSPSDKADNATGSSNDPPPHSLGPADCVQLADDSALTQKSLDADEVAGACEIPESTSIDHTNSEPTACSEPERTGVNNQNCEPSEKETEPSTSFPERPTTPTLSSVADPSLPATSRESESSVAVPSEQCSSSDLAPVDAPKNKNACQTGGVDIHYAVVTEKAMVKERGDKSPELLTVLNDAPLPSSAVQSPPESARGTSPEIAVESCSDIVQGPSKVEEATKEVSAKSFPTEKTEEVAHNSPMAKMADEKPLNIEPTAEAISVDHHSIIDIAGEDYGEETANLLASVVFEGPDGRSAEHVTIVTEGDLATPGSPTETTQLLVFTVEDMDSIMMAENVEQEMSLVQVTPTSEDGGATLEFSALKPGESDGGEDVGCEAYAACLTAALQTQAAFVTDGHNTHSTENCIESAEGIAVVQVQLAKKDPEGEIEQREEDTVVQQASKSERRNPDMMITAAAVMVQVGNDASCPRDPNCTTELDVTPSKPALGQMALPNNISLLAGTSHSSLQSLCTNSSLLTVNSGGAGSAVSTSLGQHQMAIRSLSPSSVLPLKLVSQSSGINSQIGGVSENGGLVSMTHNVILPTSPVKVVMSRCVPSTSSTITLTTVLVRSPASTAVSGAHGVCPANTSTATVSVSPIMSVAQQVSAVVSVNATCPDSPALLVAPPLVRPTTSESEMVSAPETSNTYEPVIANMAHSAPIFTRSPVTSRSPSSPTRSRTWAFPGPTDRASAIQNSTAIIVAPEHGASMASTMPLADSRTSTPSPTPNLGPVNNVPVNLTTHFVPLPTVANEGKQDSMDSDADTICSSSSLSSGSGQEDGCCSRDEADYAYMGNTSITSGDHNYIFRASRNTGREKARNRARTRKEEDEDEEEVEEPGRQKDPEEVVVPPVENCVCNSVCDGSGKLEQLTIEIPADNDACEIERRATRSTRSNSRQSVASQQLSPSANSSIASPPLLCTVPACDAEAEVRTLTNRLAAKRRREDSDSDSDEPKVLQNSQNAHASEKEVSGAGKGIEKDPKITFEKDAKGTEKDVASPKSPAYANAGTNAHVYSKPVKRKCSENAVELIKACIGVDDNPKRIGGGKQHPSVDGSRAAVPAKNIKLKEDGIKAKGRINASVGEVSEESSDDEVTLSELVTKARSGKAKPAVNNATEDRSITRNSKQRQNAKEEDATGGGKIERVNIRSNSKREDGNKGGKGAGVQRESRKEERASSRLGGRHPEKGRRTSPQTRVQERSPQRTNHRSRTKEHDRAASPSNPREENNEAGKRKLRSSGSSGYYDSLPQKRRRFSRDNR